MSATMLFLACSLLAAGSTTPTRQQVIADPELANSLPDRGGALYDWLRRRSLACHGDGKRLEEPARLQLAGRSFEFDGVGLRLLEPDRDGVVRLGVLGALKDFQPATRQALQQYLDWFAKDNVDAVILAGDLASSETEMVQQLLTVADGRWPVLTFMGNTESRAAFNRAVLAASRVSHDVVNVALVQRVDLGGVVLLFLGGYHDRRFVHESAACRYGPAQLDALAALLPPPGQAPAVLLSHGPPLGDGPGALDRAVEGGNVGDPLLASFLTEHQVRFGIFGHILEAGGKSADGRGRAVKPNNWVARLYLNVGSANPLAWQLNDGRISCGLAAVVEFKDRRARYRLLRRPCR